MKSSAQNKEKLVNSVFSKVHKRYDFMNDIMSFGVHRIWKEKFINWMNPQSKTKLIDVASGTGDIAKLFLDRLRNTGNVTCVEPNSEMMKQGQIKLKNLDNIYWVNSSAERIPIKENIFDYYSISFGIRNVTNINLTLKEAYRVLKTGGRFMCLEFSKIDNELINFIYKQYSKAIPQIGKVIVGSAEPYEYLTRSINNFYNQEELKKIIKEQGFENVEYRNLTNGIAAIHSGWKI